MIEAKLSEKYEPNRVCGLKMKFVPAFMSFPKLIKVTISELDQLYVGVKGLTTNGVNQIIQSQNHALCCSGMKNQAPLMNADDLTDQSKLLGIFSKNYNDLK